MQIKIKNTYYNIPGHVSDDIKWMFPVIKSNNIKGKLKYWSIYVTLQNKDTNRPIKIRDDYINNADMPDNIIAIIKVDSWQDKGKVSNTKPTILTTGKTNTNVFVQALRDANGLYNKQLKKTSAPDEVKSGLVDLYPPMLAQDLDIYKKPPTFEDNTYIQRKYDGLRCVTTLSNDNVIMYSRTRKLFLQFQHMRDELKTLLQSMKPNVYLDGEIYKYKHKLQEISGNARREITEQSIDLDYYIYDCFIPDITNKTATQCDTLFTDRLHMLEDAFKNTNYTYLKLVPTYQVTDMNQIETYFKQFIAEEYEGAIIRYNTPYIYSYHSHRSSGLLKLKERLDYEYTVVGFYHGKKGKAADQIYFICTTDEGKEFKVSPSLTENDKRNLYTMFSIQRPTN
jgi:ATP-dependent DNA ligase